MPDNLISLQNKRISKLEKELEKERHKLDKLVKSNKSKGLKPIHFEIENTPDGWNLTFPSGVENRNLPSLKVCLLIIKPFYRKCQFRSQSFELYDRNTKTLFRDYRVYTEWVEMAEKDSKKFIKEVRRNRISNTDKVQNNVKKIDMRIFDRTY